MAGLERPASIEPEWLEESLDEALAAIRSDFDEHVEAGRKEQAEFVYHQVYELREYMNRVHAGTVWRTPK